MSPHSEQVYDDAEPVPVLTNGHANGNGITNGHSNGLSNGNGVSNSLSNGHSLHRPRPAVKPSAHLPSSPLGEQFDLVCIGFGPASLGVAVAMHDALAAGRALLPSGSPPRVLFLEKQSRFAWHSGMLLPGARMQISFIKDMASLRDPRSHFTFLNYLHAHGRLVEFTNMDTFLPARSEYEDYLAWCAAHFDHLVQYGSEVVSVAPDGKLAGAVAGAGAGAGAAVRSFSVRARNAKTGHVSSFRARHVLVATGGQPSLPRSFPAKHPRVIHSSQFAHMIPHLLPDRAAACRVVVVGAGQSAAEIFHTIQQQYPRSKTYLVMRPEYLRPSDDSPFVNSIFNPDFVDSVFPRSARSRQNFLDDARATNYSVVRLNLIETLYELMYEQLRTLGRDETQWPHRILAGRQISSIEPLGDDLLEVRTERASPDDYVHVPSGAASAASLVDDDTTIAADVVIAATGYSRCAHVDMLRDAWPMLPKAAPQAKGPNSVFSKAVAGWNVPSEQGERNMSVGRDYRVKFQPGTVDEAQAGVWLQGLCEGTHGLSDSLLSIIATRSGEIVDSIFGAPA
ncbi:L-lysine 6-monooxygenase (NADPH-requiring)-domain-containing protein [Stachybotrys elegans]|uniref:L-ornithine N(5)-monooxygenase [NAD(P)H] n=1 Tax=Stachybotrys elegans TaxID=80388 RepID=A0A8K0T1M6_9HYPO|nr:L-lysine 6-monooxygenase (NADPH-requiring)-domain-containing protein [Stachybotrys elegans]